MNQKEARKNSKIQQEYVDRIEIRVNQYVDHPSLNTPLIIDTFGFTSVGIRNDLNQQDIQDLQEEFDNLNFIDGKIVVNDN